MFGLPLAFTVPAILGALVLLPPLYFLLRVTPPRPQRIAFPPLRLLLDLRPKDETPAHTPLWLLLLRLAVAACIILAMAGPIWNPPADTGASKGPLVVILDDGFSAAPDWERRVTLASQRLDSAEHRGRVTAVAPISAGARGIEATDAAHAIEQLRALKPVSWRPDRLATLPAFEAFAKAHPDADYLWIADGIEESGARAFAQALTHLATAGRLAVVSADTTPLALAGVDNKADVLDARIVRASPRSAPRGTVRAFDAKGLAIGEAPFAFAAGNEAHAQFELPIELRNQVARLAILDEKSAGAVALLDARWRRRRVGLITGESVDVAQPLVSPAFFISRALTPFADVREARGGTGDAIQSMLDLQPSVMVLADVGGLNGADHDRLAQWVEGGGTLVRFAGIRLAASGDDLVPVALRRGGRTFGGALSWDQPKPLAPFERGSPFYGLAAHETVTVMRQVLAEPSAGLPAKTWAQLSDGTPLVTGETRGKGTIVLFHVTADTTWSNLPLSGLFVDMLRRVVDLSGAPTATNGSAPTSQAAPAPGTTMMAPSRILDGFGVLASPPPFAKPVPETFRGMASADHPPGLYGPADAGLAVNAMQAGETLTPMDLSGLTLDRQPLQAEQPIDLRPILVALALAGFLVDALASLWLGGALARRRGSVVAASFLMLAVAGVLATGIPPVQAETAQPSRRDIDSALTTRLGYVVTGDAAVDEASRLGLETLSRALAERTSLSPGDPVALDPAKDELAFYPMLYWPVLASAPQPDGPTVNRVASYMKNGGTIVFDTRDALVQRPGAPPTPEAEWLRQFLSGVDVPELEPVPSDHVVTKTFYLLSGFVGRYASGQTWIEALPPATQDQINRPVRAGDDVSPIIITSNDLAGGWAADADGEPVYPLVPGGSRQRELAIRGGINLVMYTLTGNYKADQVHVRDLLERLAH